MRITVRFFAILKDRAGVDSTRLELTDGSRISDAMKLLETQFASIKPQLARAAVAINRNYEKTDSILQDGDELALLPPVSGG